MLPIIFVVLQKCYKINAPRSIFTFSSHTEYVKRESIVIAWVEKKNSLRLMNVHVLYMLKDKSSKKKFPSVCLSVCLYVRTWTFHVDTITFEGISGSKQNLVGVFYVWNVGLLLKSKVKSWSWSKSWSWTEFRFSQKLCGATPNFFYLECLYNFWRTFFRAFFFISVSLKYSTWYFVLCFFGLLFHFYIQHSIAGWNKRKGVQDLRKLWGTAGPREP